MTGIPEAIAALSGIKTIASGLVATRDEAKVMEVKLALMEQVYQVRQALDSLQDEVATIKQQNRELDEKNRQLQKRLDAAHEHELFEVIGGVFVLAAKPIGGATHAPPYYCQTCHREGNTSTLSFEESTFGNSHFPAHLHCQRNKDHTLNLPGGTKARSLGFKA
ncbi:hypothetical protein ACFIQG_21445 [Comamonas odontotermitis]|uniref:hypothetical protein n=1 Tax=Comamonas odontotermitis TaxID=379895 RepID=UPI0036715B1C